MRRRAERLFGPSLTLKELNLICWGCFLAFLVMPLSIVAVSHQEMPDADFVNFYAMGRILNEHGPEALYDPELQTRIRSEVHPLKSGAYYAVPYPPFVGTLFRPLARLPYVAAYAIWLSITLALYLAGLGIAIARFFPHERLRQSLIYCFALSFHPFLMETLINGQVAAIGFLAFALAAREEDTGRPFTSGLALSACLYKPTLLILMLPMLLVSKRFKVLAGFATGALALTLLTIAVEGTRVWTGYATFLLRFGEASMGVKGNSVLPLQKYVDISSFSALLPGGRSGPGIALVAALACAAGATLLRIWWKSRKAEGGQRMLVWATTVTWTLLLNVYVPLYDVILVVLSVIITAGMWGAQPDLPLRRWFTALWLMILGGSWVTVGIAETAGFQVIGVLLAGMGAVQLAFSHQLRSVQATPRAGPARN
jgi:hypothetical protein